MQQDSKQPGLSWSAPKHADSGNQQAQQAPTAGAPASPAPGGRNTMHTQAPMYASFFVAGIIIGVLLGTATSGATSGETSKAATSTAQAPAPSAASGSQGAQRTAAPVAVADQPAGLSVAIGAINIARPTWVVVYVSREGKPGNALGARLFFAGDKQGTVSLLRSTEAGQSYFVGLVVDNGDRVFSLSKDKPLADADGGPLWATFRAL